jgi:hypothetical protein
MCTSAFAWPALGIVLNGIELPKLLAGHGIDAEDLPLVASSPAVEPYVRTSPASPMRQALFHVRAIDPTRRRRSRGDIKSSAKKISGSDEVAQLGTISANGAGHSHGPATWTSRSSRSERMKGTRHRPTVIVGIQFSECNYFTRYAQSTKGCIQNLASQLVPADTHATGRTATNFRRARSP